MTVNLGTERGIHSAAVEKCQADCGMNSALRWYWRKMRPFVAVFNAKAKRAQDGPFAFIDWTARQPFLKIKSVHA
jgi:hypothetical protein